MKKITKLILAMALVMVGIITENNFVVNATDFVGKEEYYFNKCSSASLSKGDVEVCKEFKEYLSDKNDEIKNEIIDLKETISNAKDNMAAVTEKLNVLDGEITLIEEQIEYLTINIDNLNIQIQEKDELVRERMYAMQSYINGNQFTSFIMGAASFEDMFALASGITEITGYDKELIQSLLEDRIQVEEDKVTAEESKKNLEDLKQKQEELLKAYEEQARVLADQLESAYAESDAYQEEMDAITNNLNNINFSGVSTSSGWGKPIASGTVTSVGYFYPSGSYHLAMDVGAPQGTPVYAPGNGIVLYYSGTSCPSPSGYHYGSTCGGGRGNFIILLVTVNSNTYGVKYYHFNQTAVSGIKTGAVVSKGQVVGYSGNSGQTTGAHLHMEIVNLGSMTLQEGANYYSKYGSTFGLGSTSAARYTRRCDVKAPVCQENVSAIYGVGMYSKFG